MANPIEIWKAEKHSFDVWPDVLKHAERGTAMKDIDAADLERMKWHGFFYRKRDTPGRYMNRIRITAGELTADQAREIAYIAYESGHGIIDVTTRANLQVQGLEIGHLPKVAERLDKVGLSSKQTGHDNIRNVFAHPFSGLMPDELIDTRQLSHELTALFVGSREYSDLPRKLNICLNGTDSHSAHFWTQDISFLAHRTGEGEVLFQLLIGGTQGQNPHLAWHVPVLVRPEQVVDVTRSILELFRSQGSREKRNAARFRFLIERIGVTGVLEHLEQSLSFRLIPYVSEPVPAGQYDELIGWFRQSDPKLWTMGLCVPLGRMSWKQLEGLSRLSRDWGDGTLRTTHEQGIAVANIPTGFKDPAATAAAALGLTIHADPLARNTMACTGSQFCNIAVTETKGRMLKLVDQLRQRALMLHGIRIHMSGCPSSCAQHFTADIGLKGVRVRRLIGTREGFDIYLGGGLAGSVHMGLLYKLGVDSDQLPQVIDEVVNEYYLKHKSGQSFSAYWREKLKDANAAKVGDDDYKPPIWVCDVCDHHHAGEDPPVFCPSCAGLRRNFARLEEMPAESASSEEAALPPVRDDGFVFAATLEDLSENEGVSVSIDGHEYALFRKGDAVTAIDDACPHEGASLAQGEVAGDVVTCPWHGWTFNTCSGCSLEPAGNDLNHYDTLIEDAKVFLKPREQSSTQTQGSTAAPAKAGPHRPAAKPVIANLPVLSVIQETPDVRTFRLDNSRAGLPLDFPGKFAKVCVPTDEGETWRSFTISSSPTTAETIDLTIKRNPSGMVSNHLFDHVEQGDSIKLKGPQGGFFFDPEKHNEPLVLISAGSGITPMMSIVRFLDATGSYRPCLFLYGARTAADIIFHDECLAMTDKHAHFRYVVSLTQPGESWNGATGRLNFTHLANCGVDIAAGRYFICGPDDFMETFQSALLEAGVQRDRIHTEQFHQTAPIRADKTAV